MTRLSKAQADAGVTVVNDGDQSKTGFAAYITQRLTGFDGAPEPRVLNLEQREFPEWAGTRRGRRKPCIGPDRVEGLSRRDGGRHSPPDRLSPAWAKKPAAVFMTSVSPGTFTNHNTNTLLPDR